MIKRKNQYVKFIISLLIIYSFWGFIFTKTVFELSIVVYISFVGLLIAFLYVLFKERFIVLKQESCCWIPYFIYSLVTLLIQGDLEFFSYWMVCLIIILISIRVKIYNAIPYKLFLYSGIIAFIGQMVQLFLPSLYNAMISPLFSNSSTINYWSTTYGLAGFTYQLDQTAMILITAEAVVLAFSILNNDQKTNRLSWLLICLLFIGVFLSGKRMLCLVSIVVPFFVYLIQQKSLSKKLVFFLLVGIIGLSGIVYFITNIDTFYDSRFFYRFAKTFIDFQNKADFSDGRSMLASKAMNAFYENPIFGVGVGKFASYTGEVTAVHNTYLQVLCEQGIVGITLYVFPLLIGVFSTIYTIKTTNIESPGMKYYKFSLFIQMTYILYAFTENVNINMFGYVIYYIAFATYLSTKYGFEVELEK